MPFWKPPDKQSPGAFMAPAQPLWTSALDRAPLAAEFLSSREERNFAAPGFSLNTLEARE